MAAFPFGLWGTVLPTPEAGAVSRIKVLRSTGGGYLVLTVENGAEFDVWYETLEEVERDLATLSIEWA
jgi:hypothetical protein